ncbi:uncharacterized protein M6B38_198190 [Iris pallida]|uniref:Uncharacterized protein n=1 Tax=Iris pallida TaxID=29817 RepID=A0AAX6EBS5_IRIPA|nr:uncharacterized protein M6B38_198190 [Iris pallida]
MAETLTLISPEDSDNEIIDLEAFRSRLKQLEDSREPLFDSSEASASESKKLIEELAAEFQRKWEEIQAVEPALRTLDPQDLDAYMAQLKKEISMAEDENMKISSEISDLTRAVEGDSNQLDGDLEKLAFSLKLIDSEGLHYFQAESGDPRESLMSVPEDQNFEILKLHQQIEKARNDLNTLRDLENVFKRVEAIGQIEDKLSSVKVLGFEGNCIRLSLKTHMASSDGLFLGHKLDCMIEPSVVEHELLIELADKTMELHKAEIFPNDVSLDAIIHSVKSSSHAPVTMWVHIAILG